MYKQKLIFTILRRKNMTDNGQCLTMTLYINITIKNWFIIIIKMQQKRLSKNYSFFPFPFFKTNNSSISSLFSIPIVQRYSYAKQRLGLHLQWLLYANVNHNKETVIINILAMPPKCNITTPDFKFVWWLVAWCLSCMLSAAQQIDLLRKVYMLQHRNRSCWSHSLPCLVIAHWHQANPSWHWALCHRL